jgi:dephospho-CoA kinase
MEARILVIGLTGGIASGKSTAQAEFARLGATVFDADIVARELVEPGQPALAAIVQRFGADMLTADGNLDRRRMRERVFADRVERQALEAILHPAIRAELQRRTQRVRHGYVVLAIPLLVESGRYPWIDRVLVVDVPVATQLARLMQRDGINSEQAAATLAAQATREQRLAAAQDVLINDGAVSGLLRSVARLHARYLQCHSRSRFR